MRLTTKQGEEITVDHVNTGCHYGPQDGPFPDQAITILYAPKWAVFIDHSRNINGLVTGYAPNAITVVVSYLNDRWRSVNPSELFGGEIYNLWSVEEWIRETAPKFRDISKQYARAVQLMCEQRLAWAIREPKERKQDPPEIKCPECGRRMHVAFDQAGGDWFAQCLNAATCNYDGTFADTPEALAAAINTCERPSDPNASWGEDGDIHN